jgi:shikimate kinase
MKILIFGNICSGKTTLALRLSSEFKMEMLSIDDYRRKFGDGTWEAEKNVQEHFFKDISKDRNQIIETLGVGSVSEKLYSLLKTFNSIYICIILKADLDTLKKRVKDRKWDIPFPKPLSQVIPLLEKTQLRIENLEIQEKFSNLGNVIFFESNFQIDDNYSQLVLAIRELI